MDILTEVRFFYSKIPPALHTLGLRLCVGSTSGTSFFGFVVIFSVLSNDA